MKLEVKYIFPSSSSGVNFCIYQLPEGLEMKKPLPQVIRMQNQGGHCLEFPKSRQNLHCPKSSNQTLTRCSRFLGFHTYIYIYIYIYMCVCVCLCVCVCVCVCVCEIKNTLLQIIAS